MPVALPGLVIAAVIALPAMKLTGVKLYPRPNPAPRAESLAVLPFSADPQIVIAPEFPQAQRELGLAYEQKAMYQEAFDQLQKTYEMPENYGKTMLRADIGHLYAVWGKRSEAQ